MHDRKPIPVAMNQLLGLALALFFLPFAASLSRAEAITPKADTMLSMPCKRSEKCRHHWTLTSRLGHMLEIYEKALGRRNPVYRILGLEFTSGKRPRTWYPDFGDGLNSIIVQLTKTARYDQHLALFQLGHEAFHLIEPIKPGSRGSFLEEGLASYFAVAYMDRVGVHGGTKYIVEPNYKRAYDLVVRLAKQYKDFYPRLRRLRRLTRSFSRLSSDDIRVIFPEAPAALARQLARPFSTASGQR